MGILDSWKAKKQTLITAHYERYVLTALCIYGIAVHLSPAQVFFQDYITEETHLNISRNDSLARITPVRTYSYLILLQPVILLTDIVRYKPALTAQVAAYVCGYIATLGATSLGTLQFAEILFGLSWALQIAQLTFGFASLHSGVYKKVSVYVHSCNSFSIAFAAAIGELHIGLTESISVNFLNGVSIVTALFSFIWVLLLPSIPRQRFIVTAAGIQPVQPLATINAGDIQIQHTANTEQSYQSEGQTQAANLDLNQSEAVKQDAIHSGNEASAFTELTELQDDDMDASVDSVFQNGRAVLQLSPVALHDTNTNDPTHLNSLSQSHILSRWIKANFQPIWLDFSQSYSNSYILKWSVWWSVTTCVYIEATWYCPQLWDVITGAEDKLDSVMRKAVVNMVAYIIAGGAVIGLMFLRLHWRVLCDVIVSATCLPLSIAWILSSQLSSVWLAYIAYVTFVTTYILLLTVASFEIAGHLSTGKFALVFGTNQWLGGALHLILMLVFVVLRKKPDFRTQMLVNGILILILGVGFLANIFFQMARSGVHVYCHNLKQPTYQEIEDTHI